MYRNFDTFLQFAVLKKGFPDFPKSPDFFWGTVDSLTFPSLPKLGRHHKHAKMISLKNDKKSPKSFSGQPKHLQSNFLCQKSKNSKRSCWWNILHTCQNMLKKSNFLILFTPGERRLCDSHKSLKLRNSLLQKIITFSENFLRLGYGTTLQMPVMGEGFILLTLLRGGGDANLHHPLYFL